MKTNIRLGPIDFINSSSSSNYLNYMASRPKILFLFYFLTLELNFISKQIEKEHPENLTNSTQAIILFYSKFSVPNFPAFLLQWHQCDDNAITMKLLRNRVSQHNEMHYFIVENGMKTFHCLTDKNLTHLQIDGAN